MIISDVHLGSNHPSAKQVNKDGIPFLSWDETYQFERFIKYVIKRGDIFLIIDCGDFFDNKAIRNEILKYIHTNIIALLRNAKIGFISITGNHDCYDDHNRVSSMEDLDYYRTQNCIVVRKFSCLTAEGFTWHDGSSENKINAWYDKYIIPKLKEYNIGFSFFPYTHRGIMKDVYFKHINNISDTKWSDTRKTINDAMLQQMIIDINTKNASILSKCTTKFEIGHYGLDGCKKSAIDTQYKVETGEFKFNYEMTAPNQYDYCFFGHYHHGQEAFAKNVMHVGSFNYYTFGELEDNKRYIIYDFDKKSIEYVSTINNPDFSIRKSSKLNIDIPANHGNPTEFVIQEIKKNKDAEGRFKIVMKGLKSDLNRIKTGEINDAIAEDVFYAVFDSEPIIEQQVETNQINKKLDVLDLEYMWNDYIAKHQQDVNFAKIKEFGLNALHKAKESIKIKDE